MLKSVFKDIIFPVAIASMMAFFFQPVYMANGECNILLLLIIMGLPFGIRKMMLWFVPYRCSLSSTIGILFINVLIGGIIGIFVLAFQVIASTLLLFINLTKKL